MNFRGLISYWLPPLAWMAFIFPSNSVLNTDSTSHLIVPILMWLFPHAAPETIHMLHIAVRKAFHFFNYAFLTFLLFRSFRGSKRSYHAAWIVYAGLVAVGYGGLDEFVQNFIPSRTGSVYDWLIDSAGVFLMSGIIFVKKSGLRGMGYIRRNGT